MEKHTQCDECNGEKHHWSESCCGNAEADPDHPAALLGVAVWYVCKHCPEWQTEPPDEDDDGGDTHPDDW